MLSHADMLELRRWNTPTIYNGWESITKRNRLECSTNWEEITDFMPQMGPMVGYAVTITFSCTDQKYKKEHPESYLEWFRYLASVPGPKVLFAKDLDYPNSRGALFGEVTGDACRALGCVGLITDGYVRDVDEVAYGGFKMMAKRLGVGHAYSCPRTFGEEIEIYGAKIKPGMFVHADKYGFIAIPPEETEHLLQASRLMDSDECQTTIPIARDTMGMTAAEVAEAIGKSMKMQITANLARNEEFRHSILGEQ